MILRGLKAFSILIIPLFFLIVLLVGDFYFSDSVTRSNIISLILFSVLFFIACFAQKCIVSEINKAQIQHFEKNVKIINSRGNMHLFESWIILLTPVFFYSTDDEMGVVLTLILMLIVVRIVASQELYVYNIIWIILGYKAYELQIGNSEQYYTVICIGKLSYSDVRELINSGGKYKVLSNGTYLIWEQDEV